MGIGDSIKGFFKGSKVIDTSSGEYSEPVSAYGGRVRSYSTSQSDIDTVINQVRNEDRTRRFQDKELKSQERKELINKQLEREADIEKAVRVKQEASRLALDLAHEKRQDAYDYMVMKDKYEAQKKDRALYGNAELFGGGKFGTGAAGLFRGVARAQDLGQAQRLRSLKQQTAVQQQRNLLRQTQQNQPQQTTFGGGPYGGMTMGPSSGGMSGGFGLGLGMGMGGGGGMGLGNPLGGQNNTGDPLAMPNAGLSLNPMAMSLGPTREQYGGDGYQQPGMRPSMGPQYTRQAPQQVQQVPTEQKFYKRIRVRGNYQFLLIRPGEQLPEGVPVFRKSRGPSGFPTYVKVY